MTEERDQKREREERDEMKRKREKEREGKREKGKSKQQGVKFSLSEEKRTFKVVYLQRILAQSGKSVEREGTIQSLRRELFSTSVEFTL